MLSDRIIEFSIKSSNIYSVKPTLKKVSKYDNKFKQATKTEVSAFLICPKDHLNQ